MFALWVAQEGRFLFQLEDNGGVKITGGEHAALMAAQASGLVIIADGAGLPVAVPAP